MLKANKHAFIIRTQSCKGAKQKPNESQSAEGRLTASQINPDRGWSRNVNSGLGFGALVCSTEGVNCQGVWDVNSDSVQGHVVVETRANPKDSPGQEGGRSGGLFCSMSTYLTATLACLLRVCKWLLCAIEKSLNILSSASDLNGVIYSWRYAWL